MEIIKIEKIENIIKRTSDVPSHSQVVYKIINLLKDE